jgi:hypothetical protein
MFPIASPRSDASYGMQHQSTSPTSGTVTRIDGFPSEKNVVPCESADPIAAQPPVLSR